MEKLTKDSESFVDYKKKKTKTKKKLSSRIVDLEIVA